MLCVTFSFSSSPLVVSCRIDDKHHAGHSTYLLASSPSELWEGSRSPTARAHRFPRQLNLALADLEKFRATLDKGINLATKRNESRYGWKEAGQEGREEENKEGEEIENRESER